MMDLGAAMHPPAYDSDDDAAPRPGFCLLEKNAYFDNRQNATTAVCDLEKGSIQVTFCTTHPPRASYFCVHATAYSPAKFGIEPQIVATEGPLALIRVILGGPRKPFYAPGDGEYFVYHAGNLSEERLPSLKHIPHPVPYHFNESTAAIVRHCPRRAITQRGRSGLSALTLRPLRRDSEEEDHDCGDCNYVIAALRLNLQTTDCYEIVLYHSKTETWSAPAPALRPEGGPCTTGGVTCKAITIGGEGGTVAWADLGWGTVAWADLGWGIIFCDVLAITDDSTAPVIRCLNLPPPIELVKESSGYLRDIALVNGSIVYTEHQIHNPDIDKPRGEYHWKAATYRIKIPNDSCWHRECSFDSSGISKSLRHKVHVHDAETIFYTGLPFLGLQDDGIVYMLSKTDLEDRDTKSLVLAVDMKKNNVREFVEFGTQRYVYLGRDFFIPSRISKYLRVIPGRTKQKPKRQKMLLQKQPGIPMVSHSDDDENDNYNYRGGIDLNLVVELHDDEDFLPVVKQPRTEEEGKLWVLCKKTLPPKDFVYRTNPARVPKLVEPPSQVKEAS